MDYLVFFFFHFPRQLTARTEESNTITLPAIGYRETTF